MKKPRFKILFLDILTDDKKVRRQIAEEEGSSYEEQIRRAFGLGADELVTIDGSEGYFPNPSRFNAVLIGGSIENPVKGEEKPWMKKIYGYIRLIARNKIPIFGICGGLQFVVRALGGKVVYNPKGREFGTITIKLSHLGKRDPLFKGLPLQFPVQMSHKCMVEKLKPHWKLLASSRLCRIQAIAIGDKIRLIQFHPELRPRQMKAMARLRKKPLLEEGFVKNEKDFKRFLSSIKDTENLNKKITKNFLTYF